MTVLHLDFETRSAVDLRKTGPYKYASDKTTDIWCAAFAIDDEPPRLWIPGTDCPEDVREHIESGGICMAHNANFERTIWSHIFNPVYGWPEPKLEQWRCTMAMALALALPGGLDQLAKALKLDVTKDDYGYRKMLQMSKPRRIEEDGTIVWWDDGERREILYDYCIQDVIVEREVEKKLLPLRSSEQKIWQIDQAINDRGVYVDADLCEAAIELTKESKWRLDRDMKEVTGGWVSACSNAKQLRLWLNDQGLEGDGVNKDWVDATLSRDDLTPKVRKALELRQQGSRTSTAKADALLNRMQSDGRARGMFQYHAATTGRWGGRGFQPQNLKRPDENTNIAAAVQLIKGRNLDHMLCFYDDPISIVGDCIRPMVMAAPGNILHSADFSNIEGRVLAWLAGEQWKLDAFAAFDRGEGEDLYKVTAGGILDKPAGDVTKLERQNIGKVSELALGYQGGVGAMMTMSKGKVPFHELYDMLSGKLPDHAIAAADSYEQRGKSTGLVREGWIAAEIIKLGWREKHSATEALWHQLEDAAISAVADPGSVWTVGKLKFRMVGSFLFMQLPSGRCLSYVYPKLKWTTTPWGGRRQVLIFWGVDSITKQWKLQDTYGGKLSENATQAVARDMLAYSMEIVDGAEWPITMHVHDELVTETHCAMGSTEDIEDMMSVKPDWLSGCPIAASGWSAERYQK